MRSWRPLALFLAMLAGLARAGQPPAQRSAPDGVWRGTAVYRHASLEFSVDFHAADDTLRAAFSSPDLLLLGQPLERVRFDRPRVSFFTRDDHPVRFGGVMAGDSISGTLGFGTVPGVIDSGAAASGDRPRFTLRRAITLPPPYATKRVTFRGDAGMLGGTIFLPTAAPHAVPGVVILQGSTANLRDEYRFYADHFARAGFGVLVFDKRGHGESRGDYGAASYVDLARDAGAAVARLRAEPRVASSRVRLVAAGFATADAQRAAMLDRRLTEWLASGRGGNARWRTRAPLAQEARCADNPCAALHLPGGAA